MSMKEKKLYFVFYENWTLSKLTFLKISWILLKFRRYSVKALLTEWKNKAIDWEENICKSHI